MTLGDDDFRLNPEDVRDVELTEVATEFGKELDKVIANRYMEGAVAVDVCWLADPREPIPEIVTWYDDPGRPKDRVDGPFAHITRYDLESVDTDEFLDALDRAPYDWNDISEAEPR